MRAKRCFFDGDGGNPSSSRCWVSLWLERGDTGGTVATAGAEDDDEEAAAPSGLLLVVPPLRRREALVARDAVAVVVAAVALVEADRIDDGRLVLRVGAIRPAALVGGTASSTAGAA